MNLSNETIRDAVSEWVYYEKTAKAKYGHISNWDTSGVTDMSNLFKNYSSFNHPIGDWDVSNVTVMRSMFKGAKGFSKPIGDWDVSNVTSMRNMFSFADCFNKPIGDWDVSNVTDMCGMFFHAKYFNQPIEGWDVSNINNMNLMFSDAKSFNQPIGGWDTSSVINMSYMFQRAKSFNQPIGNWDVSNVTDMSGIVEGAKSFNQPIGDWDVGIEEEKPDGIYLMYQGTSFTYLNDKDEEITFEASELIVEFPYDMDEDEIWEIKRALGLSVLVTKRDSYEYYLVTDLPEITDYEFTNGLGSLHVDPLNTKEEVFDFIKNLKTISFKEINPKDGESIRYID
jgi:surface protein